MCFLLFLLYLLHNYLNFMKNIIIHILFIVSTLLLSWDISAADNDHYKKLLDIQKLMFVYNIDNIDFNTKERADTLFRKPDVFPHDTSRQLAYVATGDCSICIATMMDFLIIWSKGSGLPVPTILVKGPDVELVKFYIAQEFGQDFNFDIISIPPEIYAQDGAYLIIKNKILDSLPWSINQ